MSHHDTLLVYKTFMNANSSASGDSQKKKTPMEQMKAMMEQQMELGLLKSMRSMANMASEESQPSHSQQFYQPPSYQLPSYQPPPPPIYPFSPPQYFGDYSQQQSIGAPPLLLLLLLLQRFREQKHRLRNGLVLSVRALRRRIALSASGSGRRRVQTNRRGSSRSVRSRRLLSSRCGV